MSDKGERWYSSVPLSRLAEKCKVCGKLILRKWWKLLIQMSYFRTKMHQIRSWLGLSPRPRRRAYSTPLDLLARFNGPTSKGGRKTGKEWERGRKGREGKEGKGKERRIRKRKGRGLPSIPPVPNLPLHHWLLQSARETVIVIVMQKRVWIFKCWEVCQLLRFLNLLTTSW